MTSPDISTALAHAVQSLRTERGWSLDHLAARSGVSKGVLVTLEQGHANPSLSTLARVSDAFGVPVTYLLDTTTEPSVRVTGPDQARTLWQGPEGGHGTILAATQAPWAAELWRWTLMPGESFGGEAHAPATRELAWVEAGSLTLTVAGERYDVSKGQCVRFPGGLAHSYANAGGTRLQFTMVTVVPPAPG